MKLTYLGKQYECVSAVREERHIAIHTGRMQDGEEIIYHIYGDISFEDVIIEGGEWTETEETPDQSDRITALEKAMAAIEEGIASV